ncbi:MAG: M28 family peptidase [Chthoniobacter sp.]|uniref:M28 family peptidase n=1 Tax=Chthoniobacter sp. TaxID=2510640 RepID=UPI0032A484A7
MVRFRCLILIAVVAALGGCKPAPKAASGTSPGETESERPEAISVIKSGGAPAKRPTVPPPAEIWKEFSGDKAFEEVRRQVEIGPRPSGTPELEKARVLIEESLRRSGWEVERQVFTTETPRGPVEFINVIGRFSATGAHPASRKTQRALVCSHYDTKRFSTIKFVGASDGASSTGALLELARVLALDPAMAAQVELVFFDGEEAFVQFTAPDDPKPDGLFGSRYYARSLTADGRAAQFKFGILWDMIGDRDLTITLPPDSPPELSRGVLSSAEALGLRQNFGFFARTILDDHEELRRAHIPAIDLIDFDYVYWHTAGDTLEHIAPESLQKVGAVTLHYLRQALAK